MSDCRLVALRAQVCSIPKELTLKAHINLAPRIWLVCPVDDTPSVKGEVEQSY